MEKQKRAAFCTMGCKVNSYETEAMMEQLKRDGYLVVPFEETADVYVINTCTVTQIAARKSRQMIHRARQMNPEAVVCACGCYVEEASGHLLDGLADLIVPNRQKAAFSSLLRRYLADHGIAQAGEPVKDHGPDASSPERDLWIEDSEGRSRAFLKVQDGCRQYCTYCIIPYVRGPLLSRSVADCVRETERLARHGFKEVVLTGIDLTMYGADLKAKGVEVDLSDLIVAVSKVEGIRRIRLGSLEPRVITPEFMRKIKDCRKLCPHFHLALQSGCNKTLREMNRRYTAEEFAACVERIRRQMPQAAITTDIIVGFPGETQEDHEQSLAFVQKIGFSEAHVFRYSRMEGTPAARRKDQVREAVKKERSEQMLKVCAENTLAFMKSMQGSRVSVLLEERDDETGLWTGYTPNYVRTALESQPSYHAGMEVETVIRGYAPLTSANHDASGVSHILKGECSDEQQ